jgi:choline dehydrogenase-like flavoprotein
MANYDYIVLGAGSAGCVVAARLSEDPNRRVLILEAGGSDDSVFYRTPGMLGLVFEIPKLRAKSDWGYKTVPQQGLGGRELRYTRGRILGGCSSINGMMYVRGHRQNYDDWGKANPGWSYDDVLPYFRRSERHEDGSSEFHGGDGPLDVTRQREISPVSHAFVEAVSRRCNVPVLDDFNGAADEGSGYYHQTVVRRKRASTSVAFLRPALNRPNLDLITHAFVSQILIERGRAVGVEYRRNGETHRVYADGEVICSLGAIGSPQVLMLSGIGPAEHLRAKGIHVVRDMPVGENLHDQFYVPMRFHAKDAGHRSHGPHFAAGMFQEFILRRGWMGETFIDAGAFVKTRPNEPLPDLQFFVAPWAYPEPNDDVPKVRPDSTPSCTLLPTPLYPKSRGTVRLRSNDPDDKPLIDPAYLTEPEDLGTILRGYRLAREIAATEPLAGQLQGEVAPGADRTSDVELTAEIRHRCHTVYHPVGTCRMAPGDDGVVDEQLRVKGIEGLRVADASIMPSIIGGNTNAPCIMIGEKCADMVRGDRAQSEV